MSSRRTTFAAGTTPRTWTFASTWKHAATWNIQATWKFRTNGLRSFLTHSLKRRLSPREAVKFNVPADQPGRSRSSHVIERSESMHATSRNFGSGVIRRLLCIVAFCSSVEHVSPSRFSIVAGHEAHQTNRLPSKRRLRYAKRKFNAMLHGPRKLYDLISDLRGPHLIVRRHVIWRVLNGQARRCKSQRRATENRESTVTRMCQAIAHRVREKYFDRSRSMLWHSSESQSIDQSSSGRRRWHTDNPHTACASRNVKRHCQVIDRLVIPREISTWAA